MSRLIQWNMMSLDGFFEGEKSWDVEWFFPFFGDEMQAFSLEQLRSAGMLLFGRGLSQASMKLLEARPLSNGCVILRYEPLKSQ